MKKDLQTRLYDLADLYYGNDRKTRSAFIWGCAMYRQEALKEINFALPQLTAQNKKKVVKKEAKK